jgi:hypothetical protein
LGAIWEGFVVPALPQMRNSSVVVTLSQPASRGYRSIELRAHAHYRAYPNDPESPPDGLKIDLTRSDGTVRELVIDSATLHFRDTSIPGSAMSTTPLDGESLVAWLKGVGVQAEAGQLNREMSIAMTQVHQLVSRPPTLQIMGGMDFGGVGSSSTGSTNPLPWVGLVPLFVAAIVWGIGLIRILRQSPMAVDSSI